MSTFLGYFRRLIRTTLTLRFFYRTWHVGFDVIPAILALATAVAASPARVPARRAGRPRAGPGRRRPNVLLVTIDTLRADHVGCYGYAAASTPTIDALAARGVRFETVVAQAPLTGPSHATILTGLTPLGHGYRNNSGFVLPASVRRPPRPSKGAGYRTAAFVSGFPLDRRFGFDRGFDVYDDHLPRGNDRRRTPYVERFADATTDAALKWVVPQPGRRHRRALVPLGALLRSARAVRAAGRTCRSLRGRKPYDGEIAFVDRELARLLQQLDRARRSRPHAHARHGGSWRRASASTARARTACSSTTSTLRVPWIMAGPGIAAGRVAKTVARSIDILPTLLDYAGVPSRRPARWPIASASGRRPRDGRRAGLRRVALFRARARVGAAPRDAPGAPQVHRRAARGALRPRARTRRETANLIAEQARASRTGCARACRRRSPGRRPPAPRPDRSRGRRAAHRARLRERQRPARVGRERSASRSQGRHQVDAAPQSRHVGRARRARRSRSASSRRCSPRIPTCSWRDGPAPSPMRPRAATTSPSPTCASSRRSASSRPKTPSCSATTCASPGQYPEAARVARARRARESRSPRSRCSRSAKCGSREQAGPARPRQPRTRARAGPRSDRGAARLGDLALLRARPGAADGRYARILALDADDVEATTKLGVVRMRDGPDRRGDRPLPRRRAARSRERARRSSTWPDRSPRPDARRTPCPTSSAPSRRTRRRWP